MTVQAIALDEQDLEVLFSAKEYQQRLLQLIAQAKQRIVLTLLYLEDDQAGRQVLEAIYQAKLNRPELEVTIFVDGHRAQRGLIGHPEQLGNRAMYQDFAEKHGDIVNIYGITVKSKEWKGVLHLKGMIFDEVLLYSGASINNVYLHQQNKYRLDRYHQIHSKPLTDSFCDYLQQTFVDSDVFINLTSAHQLSAKGQKLKSKRTTSLVKRARYRTAQEMSTASLSIIPLVGCGRRKNLLNQHILQLIAQSQSEIVLFTPYFNLPKSVIKQLALALKRGVNITIIVGDKTANDFYIADPEKFSTIGIIPYVYEQILRRFVKRWQAFVTSGQLTVKLWQHGNNSYHAKGMVVDKRYHLITGSNLNPRAWNLDLENGLLIDDPTEKLWPSFGQELATISQHSQLVSHHQQIDAIKDYPSKPQKLLRRLSLSKIDRLLKRFL